MNEMTYDYFMNFLSKEGSDSDYELHKFLNEMVNKEKVIAFYPKGLFKNENNLEVYLFLKDKLSIYRLNEARISLEIINYDQIKTVKFDYQDIYNPASLEIILENQSFEFNSHDDTNNRWAPRFIDLLKKIVKTMN